MQDTNNQTNRGYALKVLLVRSILLLHQLRWLLQGSYTSSTHTLVSEVVGSLWWTKFLQPTPQTRVTLDKHAKQISIVASYDGDYEDVPFTVQVYSNDEVQWVATPSRLIFSQNVSVWVAIPAPLCLTDLGWGRSRQHSQRRMLGGIVYIRHSWITHSTFYVYTQKSPVEQVDRHWMK